MAEQQVFEILRSQPEIVEAILKISAIESNGAAPEELVMCASLIRNSLLEICNTTNDVRLTMYEILNDLASVLEIISSAERCIYPGEISYVCNEYGLRDRLIRYGDIFGDNEDDEDSETNSCTAAPEF